MCHIEEEVIGALSLRVDPRGCIPRGSSTKETVSGIEVVVQYKVQVGRV